MGATGQVYYLNFDGIRLTHIIRCLIKGGLMPFLSIYFYLMYKKVSNLFLAESYIISL